MGAGRAGWYSWDAIDNGGTPSAKRVSSELQTVVPGDIMRAVPGATDAFVVAAVEPPRDLVLTVPDGHGGNAVAWEHGLNRSTVVEHGSSCEGGRPLIGSISLAHSRPPVTTASSSNARMRCCARLPRPLLIGVCGRSATASWRRDTCAAFATQDGVRTTRAASLERWRKPLLTCGILAAVLYVAMTLLVGMLWEGYSGGSSVQRAVRDRRAHEAAMDEARQGLRRR